MFRGPDLVPLKKGGGVPNLPNLKILLAIILPISENFEKNMDFTAPKAPFRKILMIFLGKVVAKNCNVK